VKLVACPNCHAQYDVSHADGPKVACRCGTTFSPEPPAAKDFAVTRCSACGALVAETEQSCSYCHAEVVRRPAPYGPVCPECYARNPEASRFCTACGVAFLPQPIRGLAESLHCPVCPSTALEPRSLGGIWVEECPSCLGIWTPGDVMDRLVDKIRERFERGELPLTASAHPARRSTWQREVEYRKCPECGGAMQRKNFGRRSGVIVDWCGSHGTWLDPNEMQDIAAFVLEGGLSRRAAGPGDDRGWSLPADAGRIAAIAAAEQIMAQELERGRPGEREIFVNLSGSIRGIGDLFSLLLKRRT
jgi:Zn-finger nucleic acid-binding protein/ribosomal protein L40E